MQILDKAGERGNGMNPSGRVAGEADLQTDRDRLASAPLAALQKAGPHLGWSNHEALALLHGMKHF